MAVKPAAGWVLVTPTGDNDQRERPDGIIVVQNAHPEMTLLRGVVRAIGTEIHQDFERGHVVHYDAFRIIDDCHLVHETHVLAWEGDDE